MGKGGSKEEDKKRKQQQRACAAITVLLVAVLVVLVVLYFTVFQPKDPTVRVPMMQLASVEAMGGAQIYPPSSSTRLNLTLFLQISIHNPNKATFLVHGGVSCLYFCDSQVGFTNLPPGEIPDESTATLTSPLTVQGSPLQGPNLVNDLLDDATLDVETSVTITGRVTTLNLFTHHANVISKCFVRISPTSKTILSYTCHPSYSLDP